MTAVEIAADIIEWLRSDEGEQWSRLRARSDASAAPRFWQTSPGNPAEDPCGTPHPPFTGMVTDAAAGTEG